MNVGLKPELDCEALYAFEHLSAQADTVVPDPGTPPPVAVKEVASIPLQKAKHPESDEGSGGFGAELGRQLELNELGTKSTELATSNEILSTLFGTFVGVRGISEPHFTEESHATV